MWQTERSIYQYTYSPQNPDNGPTSQNLQINYLIYALIFIEICGQGKQMMHEQNKNVNK